MPARPRFAFAQPIIEQFRSYTNPDGHDISKRPDKDDFNALLQGLRFK